MKLEEIDLGYKRNFEVTSYERMSPPYSIAFVYSKCGRNCIVKGDHTLVREYIKNNFSYALVNFSMWKDGRSRNFWRFIFDEKRYCYNLRSQSTNGKKKYVLRIFEKVDRLKFVNLKTLTFRRMPNRWIDDFNIHCDNNFKCGDLVKKKSGKPFKNGEKTAVILSFVENTNGPKKLAAVFADNSICNLDQLISI